MADPIDYAYNNYVIQPSKTVVDHNNNTSNLTNYNYDDPNLDITRGQQSERVVIPFNIVQRLNTTTASTTLLRPKLPGALLPLGYEPTNYDICSGRGKRNWNHSPNVAFRELIQNATPIYMGTATKNEKTAIVCNIVEGLRELGFQFLKQDSKTGRWYDMGDAQARDKVGHSLRDQVTAYNRAKITGAPLTMVPLTMENVIEWTKNEPPMPDQHGLSTHVRRPSMALSDSGNEAEARRMALATTAMHGDFARRPSWVASSGSTSDTAVFRDLDDNNTDKQVQPDASVDVVGDGRKIIPRSQSVHQAGRLNSWEFLDTFDYYIDNDMELTQSGGSQSRKTSLYEVTPTPSIVVSDKLLNHYPLSGGVIPVAPTRNIYTDRIQRSEPDNIISSSTSSHDQRKQSMTMEDVWGPRTSNRQVEKMLHESVESWDPRLSGANASIVSVRRSAMAGGTTLRRLTSSFKPSDRSMESILDGMDFGNSTTSFGGGTAEGLWTFHE